MSTLRFKILAPLTAVIFAFTAFWPGALNVAFAHNAQSSGNAQSVAELATQDQDGFDDVEDFHATGSVEQIGENFIVVSGQSFSFDETTQFDTGIEVGAVVDLEYLVQSDGSFLALEIETDTDNDALTDDDQAQDLQEEPEADADDEEDFKVTGVIEALSDTSVTIGGQTFSFDGNSALDEGLRVGVVATVEFTALSDGSFLVLEIETDADDDLDTDEDDDVDEDEADDQDDDDDDNSGHGNSHDDDDDDEDNSGRGNSHDEDDD